MQTTIKSQSVSQNSSLKLIRSLLLVYLYMDLDFMY